MHYPLISIITPALNSSKYIEQCIQSVLSQDYANIEHILIDGGSTDGSLEILGKYKCKYPDKIIVLSGPDSSVGEAWNKGWKKASGDILGWLGSDDMYEPGAISEVVKFFKENPDVYFLVGKCNLIDDRGKKISTVGLRNYDIKKVFRSGINPIPASSAFYRTEVIKKVGFLNPDIQICDFDYWIRVSNVFRIYPLDRVFSSFRIHTSSATGLAGSYSKYAKEMHRLIKYHYNKGFSFSWVIGYLLSVIIDMMRSFLGPSILYYKFLYSLKKIWLTINPFINTRQN